MCSLIVCTKIQAFQVDSKQFLLTEWGKHSVETMKRVGQ